MSKVTKKEIRDNLATYVHHVAHADAILHEVGGEPLDMTHVAVGADMMAQYVIGVIDGEVALDHDVDNLEENICSAAFACLLDRAAETEGAPASILDAIAELADALAAHARGMGGDADDE